MTLHVRWYWVIFQVLSNAFIEGIMSVLFMYRTANRELLLMPGVMKRQGSFCL